MDMIGRLDKIVAFQTNAPVASGAGNRDIYSTVLTTRGYLKFGGGSRSGADYLIEGNQAWTLIVRKENALVAILGMSLKVLIEGKLYTVQSFEDIDEEHGYYKFSLTRQQGG